MGCPLQSGCISNPGLSKLLYYRLQDWGLGTQESEGNPGQKQRSSQGDWTASPRLGQSCEDPDSGQALSG